MVLRSVGCCVMLVITAEILGKKPYVNKGHRQKRLTFAKEHKSYSDSYWNFFFSNESKCNIHGSDGREKVWRKPNTELNRNNTSGTVKHGGGSAMVWGGMSAYRVGNLVFIDRIMDRHKYWDILKGNLEDSAKKWDLKGHISSNKIMTQNIRS